MTFAKEHLENFPTAPGVYIMTDRAEKVLYVGKANNLKQRIKQYFIPGRDNRPTVPLLVAAVTHIETVVVHSEREALVLENTLIKQHQPKYNILLKDDKSYISLTINHKHRWPMVRLMRYHKTPKENALYFGPYTNTFAARQTLELLQRIFPLRQCSDRELMVRTRPCILYDMKRCIAPCVERCTDAEYQAHVQRMIKLLKGQNKEVLKELYQSMQAAAEALEFEEAAAIQQKIKALEQVLETQHVAKISDASADVLGLYRRDHAATVTQLFFREGKLVGAKPHHFDYTAEDDAELLTSFILQQYSQKAGLPAEILLPLPLESAVLLQEMLSDENRRKISLHTPSRGDKLAWINIAQDNAKAAFEQTKDLRTIRAKTLLELEETLECTNYPHRIECFDVSHTAGQQTVAALVTFVEGFPEKKSYRHYRLRAEHAGDDLSALREVLTRRFRNSQQLPDLLIIDGGKNHLQVAREILESLDISTVDLISVAKESAKHTKGMTQEKIFLREREEPLILPAHAAVLLFLQQIRDEVHRFAITFHRKKRSQETIKSILDTIPAIGPTKKKRLLQTFGSPHGIATATDAALLEVPGVTEADVRRLRYGLKKLLEKPTSDS